MSDVVSAVSSLAGPIMGLLGGGSPSTPSVPQPNVYQPQSSGLMDMSIVQNQQKMLAQNPYTQAAPQYAALAQQGFNNPYIAGMQAAAGGAGQQYGTAGQQMAGGAGALQQGAQQVMQTAMDPQQALYNRSLQQMQDQVRAGLAARGLDMSGTGAGIENQALGNFNIDWQNNLLNRQLQGLSGAGAAYGQMGDLGTRGAASTALAGATPYSAYQQGLQGQLAALQGQQGAYAAGTSPEQQAIQNALQYLSLGQGAAGSQFSGQLGAYPYQQQASQQAQQDLGNLLGGVGNLFGGSVSAPSGTDTYNLLQSQLGSLGDQASAGFASLFPGT